MRRSTRWPRRRTASRRWWLQVSVTASDPACAGHDVKNAAGAELHPAAFSLLLLEYASGGLGTPSATQRLNQRYRSRQLPRTQVQRRDLRGQFGGLGRHHIKITHHAVLILRRRQRERLLRSGQGLVLVHRFIAEMMQECQAVLDLLERDEHGLPVLRAVLGQLCPRVH